MTAYETLLIELGQRVASLTRLDDAMRTPQQMAALLTARIEVWTAARQGRL